MMGDNSWMRDAMNEVTSINAEREARDHAKAAIEIRDCLVWDGNVPQFSYDDGAELRKMGLLP